MLRDVFGKQPARELTSKILTDYEERSKVLHHIEDEPLAKLDAPEYVKAAIERLHNNSFSDVTQEFKDCSMITEYFENKIKSNYTDQNSKSLIKDVEKSVSSISLFAPQDISGYSQAGSQIRKLFSNPWQAISFVNDAYNVAARCRRILWEKCYTTGFVIEADSKVSKKKIKQLYEVLESINFNYKRNKIRDNIASLQNSVTKQLKNKQGSVYDLELYNLSMMAPIFMTGQDKIAGYNYYQNTINADVIPANEVDHLFTFSATSNVMAQPTLWNLLVLVESALASQVYQNTVMQKGGLLRGIFSMRELSNGKEIINDKTYLELAETMTKFIEKRFGGVRGSGQLGFLPFADKYFDLSKVSDMDHAFTSLNNFVAVSTCSAFGIPPELCNLQRGSQYRNEADITDSSSVGLDNSLYYTIGLTDEYLNKFIANMGFEGLTLNIDGAFSSISLAAAEFGYKLSQMQIPTITVNEFRVKVLRWRKLEGSEGNKFIGEIKTVEDMAKAIGPYNKMNIRHIEDREIITHHLEDIKYY